MKKKIISAATLLSLTIAMTAAVNAQETQAVSDESTITVSQKAPTIIVDERELAFADQGPVIVEETSRTLIPLRFVLESAGAKVDWNGDTKTVTVNSGDNRNRVILTIGSNEMKVYFYPSVRDSISETQNLDQAPVIMNDRTMIPVRAVLEAIGATVEWDEENCLINVTSRAYNRYLRDMGVEGYDVTYPLSGSNVTFDVPKPRNTDEAYDAKKDLPTLSLSADVTEAAVGDTVDVYVNLANVDKVDSSAILATMTLALKYDNTKLAYDGYTLLKDGEEYTPVMDASNPSYLNDSVKIVTIATLAMEETTPTTDGIIAKVTFEVLDNEATEVSLTSRSHPQMGMDTTVSFKIGEKLVSCSEANELTIDKTPVIING